MTKKTEQSEPAGDTGAESGADVNAQAEHLEQLGAEAAAEESAGGGDEFVPGGEGASAQAAPADPYQPDAEQLQMIQQLVAASSALIATRRGPHWVFTDQESATLADPVCRVLNKWCPELELGPEAALLTVAVGLTYPRIQADLEAVRQRRREQADAEQQGDREAGAAGGDSSAAA